MKVLQEFVPERVQEGGRVQRHGDGGPDQHHPGYHRYTQYRKRALDWWLLVWSINLRVEFFQFFYAVCYVLNLL